MVYPRPVLDRRLVATLVCVTAALSLGLLGEYADAAGRRSVDYLLPQDTLERFEFEASHHLTTEFVRLPPEADAYDVASLGTDIADVHTTISGGMERFVGRVFRDRSLGIVSRLVDLNATVDRGEGPVTLSLADLDGKSVSLRTHGSGELLDSYGWQHILGAGRSGDLVVEALLMQVFRLPAHVPKGDASFGTTYRLRFSPDASVERNWDHVVVFTAADPPADCRRCVAMNYRGDLQEASRDKHPARPMALKATGSVEGTILLGPVVSAGRRALLSNSWSIRWQRTITSERAGGATRGEIEQTAEITGRFYRGEGS